MLLAALIPLVGRYYFDKPPKTDGGKAIQATIDSSFNTKSTIKSDPKLDHKSQTKPGSSRKLGELTVPPRPIEPTIQPKSPNQGGQLEVIGVQPSPVSVLINGYDMGIAPGQFQNLPVGKVKVTLRALGYQDHTVELRLKKGDLTELNGVRLEAMPAILAVSCNISGAKIEVNGQVKGTTVGGQVVEVQVPPGSLSVRVGRKGYKSHREKPTLASGVRVAIKVDLQVGNDAPADMVEVPAGKFTMGSNSGDSDEKPVRQVYLDTYSIDKTEVTVAAYKKCVDAGGCTVPVENFDMCTWEKGGKDKHPINCVNWNQAKAFCGWAGKKLPTEAQWEKAARGTDGRKYPWGNGAPSCQNTVMDGCSNTTQPVGSKVSGASPYGALDMAGNVWEWTADWKGPYDSSQTRNPRGPSTGSLRVARGGCSGSAAKRVRAADRSGLTPSDAINDLGFRCAR